jgi:hypothetical protein
MLVFRQLSPQDSFVDLVIQFDQFMNMLSILFPLDGTKQIKKNVSQFKVAVFQEALTYYNANNCNDNNKKIVYICLLLR